MPSYYLAKSEPKTYSIDDLEREKVTKWDGVHNHQALIFIKQWKVGDHVFIYHSQGENSIVGLAKVISEPEKDNDDPRGFSWFAKLEFVRKYSKEEQISLKQIKETGKFDDWYLVRIGRLSVMPCPDEFVSWMSAQGVKID